MADTPARPSWWGTFIDSLATEGGNLALLSFFVVFMLCVLIFTFVRYGPSSPSAITIGNAFMGFVGALTLSLRGRRQSTTAVSTDTHTETPGPDVPQ